MKFKSIDAYGFKSFADKAHLEFQDGITAIVGPNGCGKSNVVDAVRWVLGERSAKLLRGKSMQDVIFNGTERRKAMSYSEVSLTFNNEGPDRIFRTLDFDEVIITRKLYKNGNSEYYINGTQAKLTDLAAIVRETGLGREGYSIIGQGKIDEIVKSKPENRRSIFEDAAGVLPSKQARREALKNLEDYEVNKQQLEALLAEIERNVTSLERKAEAAKKYFAIRDELMQLEANSYIFQKDNQAAQKERISGLIAGLSDEIDKLNKDLESKSTEFEQLMAEQTQVDEQLSKIQKEQTELAVKQENILGQGNTYSARKEGILNSKSDYANRLKQLEEDLDKINANIRENYARKQMAEEDKVDIENDYNEAVARQNELTKEILDRETALESKNSEINKLLESFGDIKANYSKIEAQKQAVLDRIGEYNEDIDDLNSQIDNNEAIRAGFEGTVNKLKDQKDRLEETITKLNNRYGELEEAIEKAREEFQDLEGQRQSLEGQRQTYEALVNNRDGFAGPVQKLLKAAQEMPYIKSKLIGVVADLITVPKNIQYAVEIALGNSIQNIVVENEYNARDLINFQKQNNIGRITFLPLSSYRPRELEPQCRNIVREKGCLGVASELIKYDRRFDNIFSGLLGNTVICENVDIGIELSRKYNNQVRIVTLDGELFNTTGSIQGGAGNKNVGILSAETRLQEIKESLRDIIGKLKAIKTKYDEDKSEYGDLAEQIEEYEKEAEEVTEKFITENSRYEAIINVLVDLNKRLDEAKDDKAEAEKQYQIYVDALAKVASQNKDITESKSDVDNAAKEGREAFNAKKKEKSEIDIKVQQLGIDLQTIKDRIEHYTQELARLENDKKNTNNAIDQCKDILADFENNIKNIDSKIKSTILSDEDKKRLRDMDVVIKQYEERKRTLIDNTRKVSEEKANISQKVLDATNKKSQNEKKLITIDERMATLEARIAEEYNLDYESALKFRDEAFEYEPAQDRIKSLKAAKNAIGPVDPNSIEEYKIEKERFDSKNLEYEDLLKAEEDLKKIIADLTTEILEKFNTEFAKIQQNFQEVFKELFAGGSGRLEIQAPEEDQDPLDAGVEIFAQPPGKKVQEMTLLSGGEQALTAMAILFAILRLRPLPFVVLDEVEAALDEGNVGVYAKYLKKFSKETQFIVITHRKPTMEKSDILFGVTMQEKGVSKIVQVSLEEAVSHSKAEAEKIS